jgi:hypothetical protein
MATRKKPVSILSGAKSQEGALDLAHRVLSEWFSAGVILTTDECGGVTRSYRRDFGNAYAVDALIEQVGLRIETQDEDEDADKQPAE